MAYAAVTPYADLTYANAYFDDRIMEDTAWADATDASKNKALRHATRLVDQCNFVLEKTDEDQVREFPRNGETDIPEEVKQATCEVALELVRGSLPESSMKKAGIASENVGDTSRSYREGGAQEIVGLSSGLPSTEAAILLRDWIEDPREIDLHRSS